ncbi:MAG: hypothetical protein HWE07_13910 [Cytophagia bacterium]|nr:hypothetical protein [Cytophagia bacterium]
MNEALSRSNSSDLDKVDRLSFKEVSPLPGCYMVKMEYIPEVDKDDGFFVLNSDNELIELNWTNAPFYDSLTKYVLVENVVNDSEIIKEYIRIFFAHVKGRHGHFIIVENQEDLFKYQSEEISTDLVKWQLLVKKVGPMKEIVDNESDSNKEEVVFSGQMIFKDALFSAKLHVDKSNGMVSLSEEELILEDLPGRFEQKHWGFKPNEMLETRVRNITPSSLLQKINDGEDVIVFRKKNSEADAIRILDFRTSDENEYIINNYLVKENGGKNFLEPISSKDYLKNIWEEWCLFNNEKRTIKLSEVILCNSEQYQV